MDKTSGMTAGPESIPQMRVPVFRNRQPLAYFFSPYLHAGVRNRLRIIVDTRLACRDTQENGHDKDSSAGGDLGIRGPAGLARLAGVPHAQAHRRRRRHVRTHAASYCVVQRSRF